jgi:pimeloyl-ACP methyl ester carboxylesterase
MSARAAAEQSAGVSSERISRPDGDVQLLRGGEGPPLLFLHAAGGAGAWLPIHATLAERFTVYAPDHPGFAGSDDFGSLRDVEDLAFHYADLIAALDLERPTVLGTSFGGWIAAELAAYRPLAIGALALVAPIGLYVEGHPIADLFAMSPERKMAALFSDPVAAAGAFPAEPDLDAILAMARDEASFARFAWAPFCHDPRLPRLLPRVEAPTLVIWGEGDALVPRAHAERYVELIPDARLTTVPDCGHAAAFERPDELAALVSAFTSEH